MSSKTLFFLLLTILVFTSCSKQPEVLKTITIINNLDMDRDFETVTLNKSQLGLKKGISLEELVISPEGSSKVLISQIIDNNNDGMGDVILFQPVVKAKDSSKFQILKKDLKKPITDTIAYCFSRFVPERTDDYTWENNKVAFRTFGPVAQKMVEDSVKGGTLSSGIDAWLKKVEYPIINKWYEKHVSEKGSYHEDTGEGLDNFHVGKSRGIGGTAIKIDSTYYASDNFKFWKTLSTGPIRTSFILAYNWKADSIEIDETKLISLDYGQNLTRFEIDLKGSKSLSVGLTLHENDGNTFQNVPEGWFSYWQPHADSELGTGIIVPNANLVGVEKYVTEEKDLSNIFGKIKLDQDQKIVFYAGFGWKESEQFSSESDWNTYLQNMSKKINNPLKISVE